MEEVVVSHVVGNPCPWFRSLIDVFPIGPSAEGILSSSRLIRKQFSDFLFSHPVGRAYMELRSELPQKVC